MIDMIDLAFQFLSMKILQKLLCSLLFFGLGATQLKANNFSISDFTLQSKPYLTSPRTLTEFKNFSAFAAFLDNGQIFSFPIAAPQLPDDFIVSQVYSSSISAFAALSTNGEVISWGNLGNGETTPVIISDVSTDINSIVSNATGFVARRNDGTLVEWGNFSLSSEVQDAISSGKKIIQLYAGYTVFIAVLEDPTTHAQTLVSWGYNKAKPNVPTLPGYESLNKTIELTPKTKVISIVATFGAVAALCNDGTVQAWGDPNEGGAAPTLHSGEKIMQLVAGQHAFAAVSDAGHIYAWGNAKMGGSIPNDKIDKIIANAKVPTPLYANDIDFAVILNDGNIFSWGAHFKDKDQQLITKTIPVHVTTTKTKGWWGKPSSDSKSDSIKFIIPNGESFAAVTVDSAGNNRILSWGSANEENSPGRVTSSKGDGSNNPVPAVSYIVPSLFSFTVLYQDRTIQSWGKWANGKTDIKTPTLLKTDGTPLKVASLTSNVNAYMAILEDGSLFYWGGACSALTDGSLQPSDDFSYGKPIFISAEVPTPKVPTPKALWLASPFAKYIYNGALPTDSSMENTTRAL